MFYLSENNDVTINSTSLPVPKRHQSEIRFEKQLDQNTMEIRDYNNY